MPQPSGAKSASVLALGDSLYVHRKGPGWMEYVSLTLRPLVAAMLDSEGVYQKITCASTWQMGQATNRDFESLGPGKVHP